MKQCENAKHTSYLLLNNEGKKRWKPESCDIPGMHIILLHNIILAPVIN